MITDTQRAMLNLVWRGVGPARVKTLLEECGTPAAAWAAGPSVWWREGRRQPRQAPPVSMDQELALIERHRVRLLTLDASDYPEVLRTLPDPPSVLYVRGTLLPEDAAAVALVGSRLASPHGVTTAERLGRELGARGLTVVSGLARGIDAAGHRGALIAGGRTIAVLGSGLARMFPAEHEDLAGRIAAQGAVISEFPMTMEPFKENFPRRNRIISGLSLGVVVVEAAAHSGALITAGFALEQGREVFAVPGPAGATTSRGTHQLLRDGAHLAESADDVLEVLRPALATCVAGFSASQAVTTPAPRLTPAEAPVYARLSTDPVGVDWLAAHTGAPMAQLLPVLLGLELKGLVRQVPGQQFVRVGS